MSPSEPNLLECKRIKVKIEEYQIEKVNKKNDRIVCINQVGD